MKIYLSRISIFFLLLSNASCNAHGQESEIDAYMNGLIKDQQIAGASVAVSKDGKWIVNKSYGYADVEGKINVTDTTGFNIMSVTKIFIACAVVQLADKKRIDLDAPITKYLEQLPKQYNNVLIYQLLNHTAGVPDYVEVDGYMQQAAKEQSPLEILNPVINKPLEFSPGKKNSYSNSGYFLLGLLIEKVSKWALNEYLAENIFKPLEMKNTFLNDKASKSLLKTKGYISVNGKLQEVMLLNPSQYWAAGGIVTTISDMIKWDDALSTGKLLPMKEVNQMMQPAKFKDGSMSDYGLGFELMNMPDMKVAGNTGAGVGFNTANMQFLNDKITVIILTNTSNSAAAMIAKNIYDMIANSGKVNNEANQTQPGKDKLDSLVLQIFTDTKNPEVYKQNFNDDASFNKFKNETINFIQSQGNLKDIVRQGEKINPQSIVRKYQISFDKGSTVWVIIFSTDGKIAVTNHL